jgi:hypothetical protein
MHERTLLKHSVRLLSSFAVSPEMLVSNGHALLKNFAHHIHFLVKFQNSKCPQYLSDLSNFGFLLIQGSKYFLGKC